MSRRVEAGQLLERLEFLLERYSRERRSTTQPYHLAELQKQFGDYAYNPDDAVVREPLLEHVGSLPVVATTFYPYIDDANVDLGRTLVMLAVHDIGELEVGDVNTFVKGADVAAEHAAALKLLDPMYHDMYLDAEKKGSVTAKFAKSIDKITPDLFDLFTPAEVTIPRLKHFTGVEPENIMDLLLKHKRPYMLWNPFMTEFHELLYERLADKLARG